MRLATLGWFYNRLRSRAAASLCPGIGVCGHLLINVGHRIGGHKEENHCIGVERTGTVPGAGYPVLSGEGCGLDRGRLAFPTLLTKQLCNNGESQSKLPHIFLHEAGAGPPFLRVWRVEGKGTYLDIDLAPGSLSIRPF